MYTYVFSAFRNKTSSLQHPDLLYDRLNLWVVKQATSLFNNNNNNNNNNKLVREIPVNINLSEIQKTTLLATAHILQKVLSIK